MRVVFLGNNHVAVQVLRWLKDQDVEIVGLVIHPEGRSRFADELVKIADLPADRVIEATRLRDPECLRMIHGWQPDLGLSIYFGYILKPEYFGLFRCGVINLHPSLLPHNRGANPNVWSIIEHTPSGVSLHYIDQGVDTGDLVAQQEIETFPWDTGFTLYGRLEEAAVHLFKKSWPAIHSGTSARRVQPLEGARSHLAKEASAMDCIDLDHEYSARVLIDLLRARTFPPYRNAYFMSGGRRVYLRLELDPE